MTEVRVHVDLPGRTVPAGTAYFAHGREGVSTTFVYEAAFLADPEGYDLEPGLVRQAGQQYIDGLPGSFSDCAPDRWGRNLIDKRRRALQRESPRRLPAATAVDYLLGVSDLTRQGNLRFTERYGPYLGSDQDDVPKVVSLPRLLAASDAVTDSADLDDLAAVKALLDAGSGSLGGARPKASVRGEDGALLVAKFPHRADEWDVMAWEQTMLDLARDAGLRTPHSRLTKVGSRQVLLVDRFDRVTGGGRVGYISAMTMVGAGDGDERDYDDIVQFLPESGSAVKQDLAELFGRVVFSVVVHNTDDHLRNHGFLRERGGWRLSPMFDVNPEPDLGRRRVTGVLGAVSAEDEVAALLDFGAECRLTRAQAEAMMARVAEAVSGWRERAAANGVKQSELRLFADSIDSQVAAVRALATS